jgi:Fe-S-cluster containining protein
MGHRSAKPRRICGACNACCVALRIESREGYSTRLDTGEDLAKSPGVMCKYLAKIGCTIYPVRPVVCRRFSCDWLNGHDRADQSPEVVGYVGIRGHTFPFIDQQTDSAGVNVE